jgi:hypothetical protein
MNMENIYTSNTRRTQKQISSYYPLKIPLICRFTGKK